MEPNNITVCSWRLPLSPVSSGGWVQTQMHSGWGKSKRAEMGFPPLCVFFFLLYLFIAAEQPSVIC